MEYRTSGLLLYGPYYAYTVFRTNGSENHGTCHDNQVNCDLAFMEVYQMSPSAEYPFKIQPVYRFSVFVLLFCFFGAVI